jgi:ADP-ribose pyrophosphatase YjhB (NUDIX family)
MTAPPDTILDWARKVQAIAHNGLEFARDPFDRERYQQLEDLVAAILSRELSVPHTAARAFWETEAGYLTPKVDARGAVFRDDTVLLVRERSDGRWTLPGGWVDLNEAPSEAVAREIREESGFEARARKLAALLDKRHHPHPPGVHHIYKLFFLCELTGGAARISDETDAVDFFAVRALPPLSLGRVLPEQIERLYQHQLNPGMPTDFD